MDRGVRAKKASAAVNIKAVAERAGVGIGSVSRVLSGHASVSPDMHERVTAAVLSLGYKPNLLAQSLRRRSTRTIGFLISDIANPLLSSIVSGAESVLRAEGYSVLLTNSGGQPDIDAQQIRLLLQRQVDGLIVLPASEDHPATIAALRAAAVPVVAIDRHLPADLGFSAVLSDHYAGVSEATRHLLQLGHRRIALVAGPKARPAHERARAFLAASASGGGKSGFTVEYGPLSAARGEMSVRRLMGLPRPPTAILLGGIQLLEGALKILQELGVVLGLDLSLICCDDIPLSRLHQPPIATVVRSTDTMGSTAATILLDQMRDAAPPSTRLLSTWFEARQSCCPAPARR